MFEGEGNNRKSKEKRLFCCHYQNIYVLLQKQKTRGHHQHRIIWERALPGLRCKDNNKNGIYQRFFPKITTCIVETNQYALKGQKLLAQGIALGNDGRKPVAL